MTWYKLIETKTGIALGPSDVSLHLIAAIRELRIQAMVELCQRVLDVLGMSAEWTQSIVVPICRRKYDIRNCICNRAVDFLENRINAVGRVSAKNFVKE